MSYFWYVDPHPGNTNPSDLKFGHHLAYLPLFGKLTTLLEFQAWSLITKSESLTWLLGFSGSTFGVWYIRILLNFKLNLRALFIVLFFPRIDPACAHRLACLPLFVICFVILELKSHITFQLSSAPALTAT